MERATFHCSSCGQVIEWTYIPGYGYGFAHVRGPTKNCARPGQPEPREREGGESR